MKNFYSVLVLGVGLVTGCGGGDETTPGTGGVEGMIGQKGASVSALDHTKIQNAVTNYQVGTGSYPSSLDDLVPDYLPVLPRKADGSMYTYDASTGKVGG